MSHYHQVKSMAIIERVIDYTFFIPGKPVILTGDGRFDSPGHSARYCHYLLIDYVSM